MPGKAEGKEMPGGGLFFMSWHSLRSLFRHSLSFFFLGIRPASAWKSSSGWAPSIWRRCATIWPWMPMRQPLRSMKTIPDLILARQMSTWQGLRIPLKRPGRKRTWKEPGKIWKEPGRQLRKPGKKPAMRRIQEKRKRAQYKVPGHGIGILDGPL